MLLHACPCAHLQEQARPPNQLQLYGLLLLCSPDLTLLEQLRLNESLQQLWLKGT